MNPSSRRLFTRPALGWVAGLVAALAVQETVSAQKIDRSDQSGWFMRAAGVARFNVKASIDAVPQAGGPGVYDDGYVLPDNGGAGSGLTWNWGYDSASAAGGDELELNRLDDVPSLGHEEVDVSSPILGGEIIGGFRFADFDIGKRTARIGIEMGLGYSGFSESMSSVLSGTASRTTDTFDLGGIVPPIAPYAGTAMGPGPLISISPAGTTVVMDVPGGTLARFDGSLDASFYTFRIGPTFELDLSQRLSVAFGAGYASTYANARLQYEETVTFTNPGLPLLAATDEEITDDDWRLGVYVEFRLNYRLTSRADVFAGLDFMHNSDFTFGDSKYEATLELGSTFGAKGGITFWF